jgi:hypothetical protein
MTTSGGPLSGARLGGIELRAEVRAIECVAGKRRRSEHALLVRGAQRLDLEFDPVPDAQYDSPSNGARCPASRGNTDSHSACAPWQFARQRICC